MAEPRHPGIPLKPFQERFCHYERVEGLTLSALAARVGWTRPNGNGDERRMARTLGFVRGSRGDLRTWVQLDTAIMLAEALHLDPHEAGF